jgi:hypothetical protein
MARNSAVNGVFALSAWELACRALPTTVFTAQRLLTLSVSARHRPSRTVLSGTQRARQHSSQVGDDHLIRCHPYRHPDPYRSVRDLGCFPARCSCTSEVPEGCSPGWLPGVSAVHNVRTAMIGSAGRLARRPTRRLRSRSSRLSARSAEDRRMDRHREYPGLHRWRCTARVRTAGSA